MAKILISSLGTGQKKANGYAKATYEYKDQKLTTTFISKALANFLDIDKLFLIGTAGSIWDSCYHEFGGNSEDIELNLYEKIDNKSLNEDDLEIVSKIITNQLGADGSKCFLIEYGINENELWNNFDKYLQILNLIEDGDEVYIDISHSFRSLALMSFLMIEFGRTIKNKQFKIGGIFYGMLEYSKENNGITPIVDLKIFYELMEWIKAINAFKNYSNAEELSLLLKNEPSTKQAHKVFSQLSKNLEIANMHALWQFTRGISKKINALQTSDNKIIQLLSTDLMKLATRLDQPVQSAFQYELALWLYENKNYALSYIALYEAIITKVCEEMKYNLHDHTEREEAKKHVDYPYNQWFNTKYENSISEIRNCIVHQCQERKDFVKQDIEKLNEFLKKFEPFIKKQNVIKNKRAACKLPKSTHNLS